MTYLDIRNSIVEQAKKYFEDRNIKINIEASAGALNSEEIKRLFIKAPSIFISIANINIEKEYIRFVNYVVVRANQKDKIYDSGLEITGALIAFIKNIDSADWGYNSKNISADCLYSGELDKINACLWAVSWDFNIRSINIDGEILDNFEGYDAEHKIENKTVEDVINLQHKNN